MSSPLQCRECGSDDLTMGGGGPDFVVLHCIPCDRTWFGMLRHPMIRA